MNRSFVISGERAHDVHGERLEVETHDDGSHRSTGCAKPADGARRLSPRGRGVSAAAIETRRGEVDERLDEPRGSGRPAGRVPQGFEGFVALPPVAVVEEVDCPEPRFELTPFLGPPLVWCENLLTE
jgi:hypothetical protein